LSAKNVHFGLCAPPILKMKCKTSKIGVVTIMLLFPFFHAKKTVTDFFWVAAGGQFGGSKMDIFV
jgi:hypothetical protein